jgi:hypothetical protein
MGHAQLKSGRYFQAIATGEAIVNSLWYYANGTPQTLSVSEISRSRDYAYDSAAQIAFYGDRVDEEGQPIPEAIAQIPPETSRLLLVFIKLKEPTPQGYTFRVVALPDSSQDFNFGSFEFINATNQQLAIDIDGEKFLLNKSGIRVVSVTPPEQGSIYLQIMRRESNDDWKSCYSNSWGHRADMRTLVFIINNEGGTINALRYRQFKQKNETPSNPQI